MRTPLLILQHTLRPLNVFRRRPFYGHHCRSEATRGIGARSPQKTVRLGSAYANTILVTHRPASCGTDPLIHYGRHFGRTVHALCTVSSILNNGILRMGELQDQPEETFTLESVFVLFILIDMILINQYV